MDDLAPIAAELEKLEAFFSALDRFTQRIPSSKYQPHEHGQLQFHQSKHMIRALFPGNGFGKTTAMGQEVHAWCSHSNRWQRTPPWPVVCIWWAQQYDQFEILKAQLDEEIVGDQAIWKGSKHCYEYPDGSRWYVLSCDRSWTSVQGINPDLVCYDEQPKLSIHREMLMRRRGKRKTRYMFAATATQGISWMKDEVYQAWLDHHRELQFDEEEAMSRQSHPTIWCWPRGGIDDNPGADAGDRKHYHETNWSSEKEKKVRLYGGFEDWTGDPIFEPEAIERLRERRKRLLLAMPKPRRGMLIAHRSKDAA